MEKKAKKAKSKTKSKVANTSSKLTAKQEQFCRIYIDILNATEAMLGHTIRKTRQRRIETLVALMHLKRLD